MSVLTQPALMTAAEFVRDYGDSKGVELVDGQLVRYPMPGVKHDYLENKIARMIGNYVEAHHLGRIMSGETFIRTRKNPDGYRAADVCFMSYERHAKDAPLPVGPWETPPDLVIEVKSPTDRLKAVTEKIYEYLEAGVTIVLLVDPGLTSVGLYRLEEIPIRFHNGDTVTLPDVLPGFNVPVKAFFE